MPIRVQLPNGRIAEFPDGMSAAQIEAAIAGSDQRDIAENSNPIAQGARWLGRAAGGLMSTLGTALDVGQTDEAPDATGAGAFVRDSALRYVPGAAAAANTANRHREIGNSLYGAGGRLVASGLDALGAEQLAEMVRTGADTFIDDNTDARAQDNARRAADGRPSLEQENAAKLGNRIGAAVQDFGRATTDFFTSDETRANQAEFGKAWDQGIAPGLKFAAENIGTTADVVAPSLIETMAPAGIAGRMVKGGLMASAAAEAEAAGARALAAGADELGVVAARTEALVAGSMRAERGAQGAALGSQAVQVTEMNARQQAEAIRFAPIEELRQNPTFVEMEAQLGEESARFALAQQVFDVGVAAGLPINAAATIIPGRMGLSPVESALAGAGQRTGRVASMPGFAGRAARAGVHGAQEAAGEAIQGGAEQLATNIAGVPAGTADGYWQDVGKNAVMEGAVGLGAGGIAGMVTGPHAPAAQRGEALADQFLRDAAVPSVEQSPAPVSPAAPSAATTEPAVPTAMAGGIASPDPRIGERVGDVNAGIVPQVEQRRISGPEAGSIIDARLSALDEAAAGAVPREQLAALRREDAELAARLRKSEEIAKTGIVPADPRDRLRPEEVQAISQRREAIHVEQERQRAATGAADQAKRLRERLGKIDRDADLITLAEELRGPAPQQVANGQANPMEAGRVDVPVQPEPAAAPAPVPREPAGAQAPAVTLPAMTPPANPSPTTEPADDLERMLNEAGAAPVMAEGAQTLSSKTRPANAPEGVALQKRWESDFDGVEREYNALSGDFDSRGGTVLNTDLARELSPEYRGDRSKSANVHEAASEFIKRLYAKKLAEPTPAGKDPVVLLTAGGTGAGKTTGERAMGDALGNPEIVYDTNMNGLESSDKKIQQALAAGREVTVLYTYRDPVDALVGGALPRAMRMEVEEGTGRTVPLAEHAKTHLGAYETIKALREKYADDPRVGFRVIDNSRGRGKAVEVDFDALPELVDNPSHEGRPSKQQDQHGAGAPAFQRGATGSLESRLREALDAEHQAGRISDAVYRGFAGQAPEVSAPTLASRESESKPVSDQLRRHAARLQAAVTAALTIAGNGKAGSSKARVFATAADARKAGFAIEDDQDGFYEPSTGTVGIIAENTPDADRALWVAMHEQSAHHGLRKTLGNAPALDAELTRAATNPTVRSLADAIKRDRDAPNMADAEAVEEALAELQAARRTDNWREIADRYGVKADDLAKRGIADVFRRLLRAIRNAIGKSGAYSDADVMKLLEDSHRAGLKPYNTRPTGARNGDRVRPEPRGRDGRSSIRPGRGDPARAGAPLRGAPAEPGATGPDPRLTEVAERYAREAGIRLRRQREYAKVDVERAKRIAAAYDAMPHAPDDPRVKAAYADLIAQTTAQYRALEKAGYKFWLMNPDADPYAGNPWNAMRDLRATQTMAVFPTVAGFGSSDLDVSNNPLLADTGIKWPYGSPDGELRPVLANDLFRAVHDAFGHGIEGAGFRARGEENAWQAHARLFTGPALAALTSETRGQNSYLNFGPNGERNRTASVEDTIFADQKTGLMPEWTWTEGRVGDMIARDEQAPRQSTLASRRRPDATGDRRARGVARQDRESGGGRSAGAQGWHQRAPKPGAVTVRGIHYSNTAGLEKLDGRKYGSNHRGAEWRRIEGDAVENPKYATLKNRVYFYPDDAPLSARGESVVGRAAVYEQSLGNVFDARDVSDAFWDRVAELKAEDYVSEAGAFEMAVIESGYDGYRTDDMVALIGVKSIPVAPLKTMASTRRFDESKYRPQVVAWAKSKFGDRVAPNGKPAWQNFTEWFGSSQVVNDKGEPLVVYHGTRGNFDVFDSTGETDFGFLGDGYYLTASAGEASEYATQGPFSTGDDVVDGANVMPAFLSIKNPKVLDEYPQVRNREQALKFAQEIKNQGHDGVLFTPNENRSRSEWVAFRPEQIKSATGNQGNFSPNEGSILKSTRRPQRNELGLYSAVEKAVLEMPLPAWKKENGLALGTEVWNKLKGMPGVKAEELKWLGIEEFLTQQVFADNGWRVGPYTNGMWPVLNAQGEVVGEGEWRPEAEALMDELAPRKPTNRKFTRDQVAEFVRNNGVNVQLVLADGDGVADEDEAQFDWTETTDEESSNWEGRAEDFMYDFDHEDEPYWWSWDNWIERNQREVAESLGMSSDNLRVIEADGWFNVYEVGENGEPEGDPWVKFGTEAQAQKAIDDLDLSLEMGGIDQHVNFDLDKLRELARDDAEEAASDAARDEYMNDPVMVYEDSETGITITGNDDIGYYGRDSRGREVLSGVYSFGEAEIQAREYAIDHGLFEGGGGREGPNVPKWGEYVTDGDHENYREYKLTLPDNPGNPFVYTSHFDDENIVAFLRVTDRKMETGETVERKPMPDDYAQSAAHFTAAELGEQASEIVPETGEATYRAKAAEQKLRLLEAEWNREKNPKPETFFIDEFQSDWGQQLRKPKLEIVRSVKESFDDIVERMKAAGVLTVECD